ncbi:MAG: carbon monoxide dehydrogenase subunit G [Alphaproteobacteria bacterium]|nr:carbon monoxide dehydrogenase subunit G [Alphaproteobacteria bacterium]
MDLTGKQTIPASPAVVWDALHDPEILKTCIPGCETVDKMSPTEFRAVATVTIGPMKARFEGKVRLDEQDRPRRCVVRGEGLGGPAGFAKGEAEVLLAADGNGTVLTYTAKASVGGKLAQIGQRLVDGAARQIADDFFRHFATLLTQGKSETVGTVADTTPSVKSAAQVRLDAGQSRPIRLAALVAIAAILLILIWLLR